MAGDGYEVDTGDLQSQPKTRIVHASGRTTGARGARGARTATAVLAVLMLAACSSAPPVGEVIPRGRVPQGDDWCRILTTEQVKTLLGDGELERVLQVGEFSPDSGVSPDCDVVWADDRWPTTIVSGVTTRLAGGEPYRDALTNLRNLLGPDGQRLSSGEVEELGPGVFLDNREEGSSLSVFFACDAGEELPTVLSSSLYLSPTSTGDQVTPEELASLGERFAELTTWVHECPGEVRPLGADDWEPLIDLSWP